MIEKRGYRLSEVNLNSMAKEQTIRKHAVKKLLEDGWVLNVPTRQRYGSSITYFGEEQSRGDDIFTLFDLIGWKNMKILLLQYTSVDGFYNRKSKIEAFLREHDLEIPPNVVIKVWGYKDYSGFEKKVIIN